MNTSKRFIMVVLAFCTLIPAMPLQAMQGRMALVRTVGRGLARVATRVALPAVATAAAVAGAKAGEAKPVKMAWGEYAVDRIKWVLSGCPNKTVFRFYRTPELIALVGAVATLAALGSGYVVRKYWLKRKEAKAAQQARDEAPESIETEQTQLIG